MRDFAGKAAASADKVRGGYYTPVPVARFLADWVRQAGPRILEPSCGDGRILRELAALTAGHGVELVAREAAKSRQFAPVDAESLFTWLPTPSRLLGRRRGNPPYIRFGNWASEQREPALELMRREGLRPSKLTNAWVPFVVASTAWCATAAGWAWCCPPNCCKSAMPRSCATFCCAGSARSPSSRSSGWCSTASCRKSCCSAAWPVRARRESARRAHDVDALAAADLDVVGAGAAPRAREVDKILPGPTAIELLRTIKRRRPDAARVGRRCGRRHRDGPQQLLHLHRCPGPRTRAAATLCAARLAQQPTVRSGLRQ